MKAIISITLVLIIIIISVISVLAVFEVITFDQAKDLGIKSIATIVIFGLASFIISLLSKSKNENI